MNTAFAVQGTLFFAAAALLAERLRDAALRRIPARYATRALAAQMGFTPPLPLH